MIGEGRTFPAGADIREFGKPTAGPGLPDVIAHGMLTMGAAMQLVADWAGDPGRVVDVQTRFTKPVVVPNGVREGAAEIQPSTTLSIVGVVGALQFEVLASRIEQEYGLPVRFEPSQFTSARWLSGPKEAVEKFAQVNKQHMATDNDGDLVYLTRLQWDIDRVQRDQPELKLTATKEMMV